MGISVGFNIAKDLMIFVSLLLYSFYDIESFFQITVKQIL